MAFSKITLKLKPELDRLNGIIGDALRTSTPMMDQIVKNYLTVKGKQIRPIMVILSTRLLGEVTDTALHGAAALEMLHNASLIHDDVVDETKLRRNRPTVNAIWDNHIAVLVGDFFVANALAEGVRSGSMKIVEALSSLGSELSLGEIDQICNARDHSFSIADYYSTIKKKTASLFMKCAEVGATACGATEEYSSPLVRYAELLGLCFQIKDDIFDYYDSEAIGKPTGNDLREGKVTLPLLHALNKDTDRAAAMRSMICSGPLSDTQIAELIQFAKEQGGIEYAYTEMERMHEQASEILREAYPESEAREDLESLFSFIISRSH